MIKKLTLVILGITLGIYLILPVPHLDLINDTAKTTYLDRHGDFIGHHYIKGRSSNIPLSKIPAAFIELLLIGEDKRFYEHSGVDAKALSRALVQNLGSSRIVSGASTISQQLVRVVYGYKRSFFAKILVMFHSFKLELSMDKGEILELYLNLVPFSNEQIGIANASKFYFDKTVNNLSLSEMSTLVALIRSPSSLSSNKGKNRVYIIKNNLLKRYFSQNKFSKDIIALNLDAKIDFLKARVNSTANHFINYVKNDHSETSVVKTSLDLNLQKKVQAILTNRISFLTDNHVSTGAVIVIKNETGEILTYLGSHDFHHPGFGQIDGVQIKRQPGSTLKPFTYALALQAGYNMGSILPDVPLYFSSGLGSYRPRNYSSTFQGPVTIRKALGNSLNIPALYMADKLKVSNLLSFYNELGLDLEQSSAYYGVGITLGNGEISLLNLTQAFTILANRGKLRKVTPFFNPKVVETKTSLEESTADIINDVLSDNNARELSFGKYNVFNTPFHLAAKTGTSTQFRDNYAIGYNQKYTVGVWVGNMDQKPMHNISGITGAGPILVDTFKILMKKTKSRPFEISSELAKVQICPLSGSKLGASCPHSVSEYFTSLEIPKYKCEMHKNTLVQSCIETGDQVEIATVTYPETYRKWAVSFGKYSLENQINHYCINKNRLISNVNKSSLSQLIEIVSPVNNSIYGLDPNIPSKYQKLNFNVYGEGKIKTMSWNLNGKEIYNGSNPDYFWTIKKGDFNLKAMIELESGKVIHKNVGFKVL